MIREYGAKEQSIPPLRSRWKGTMTDRQRFMAQLNRQPVDRCFNMEFGYWDENFTAWEMFRDNGIKDNMQADIFLNFDRLQVIGGNVWMSPPFESKVVAETATTRTVRDSNGLLAEVPKDGHATIPHFVKATIVTPDDWKQAKAERFRRDDPARKVNVAKLKARFDPPGRDYPLAVYASSMIGRVRDMLSFEGLAYACYDYPDMVEDMVETACVLVEDYLDQVLGKLDFDLATGWEDICFRNGPLVSVDFFRRVVMPRYQRISRKLRAAGVDLWWTDCDGDIRAILPSFLEGGINVMFPFEVSCSGHPGVLLDKYGPELRICGGVDKHVLAKGPAAIKEYLESLLPYVRRGGFIPHCDHRCPPDVSQENYLYYLDLKEQMFGMK